MKRLKVTPLLLVLSSILFARVEAAAECNLEKNLLNLSTIRSALAIYYSDMEGVFPKSLNELVPRYLVDVPVVAPCDETGEHHPASNEERHFFSISEATDEGGWGYVADRSSRNWGDIFINCRHFSPEGRIWLKY